MKIFSIKNVKLEFFNRPIFCESANEALTYCQNILMSDADRALIGLKDDLALYELGDMDFVTGQIRGYKNPERCCGLREVFDSIPEEKVPQTSLQLQKQIDQIKVSLSSLITERKECCSDAENRNEET